VATNDEDTGRPRALTPSNVWDRLDHLSNETREARHAQNNLFQRALHETGESVRTEIRTEVGALDQRLRAIENVVTAASPVSLGGRVNDLERWQSRADGDTSLSTRITTLAKEIDEIKAWRDEMRGSFTFIKAASVVVGLVSGIAAILSWLSFSRPTP
jgi:hypothetical protein